MLFTIILILISWLIAWRFDKQSLVAIGLFPRGKDLLIFIIGFFAAAFAALIYFSLVIYFSKSTLVTNNSFSFILFLKSTIWVLNSVAMEEYLFRGLLFYFALKKWGIKVACILSSVVFGIFHWQLNGIWGNLVPMIYIFLLTASAGWSFAYSFAKAKTILFPIGLHFGWNIINIIVFSQGPLGTQWFSTINGVEIGWSISLVLFIYQLLIYPVIVVALSKNKRLMST